jgi:uncharacterized protein YbjT (DUF2867 family)
MILVVGATGRLGGSIARALLDRGEDVRVLVRDGSTFDDSRAEGSVGDLKDKASLRKACAGVDAVVTTANAIAPRRNEDTIDSVDRDGNANLIEAAQAEGVRHLVFTSVLGASADHFVPFIKAKGETEETLKASGMTWTILQPDPFMDIWFPNVIGPALDGGVVTLVGEGKQRHSFVAMEDVVGYAVAALTQKAGENRTIQVGGAAPACWRDVVATFERVLGRDIEVQTVAIGEKVPGLPDFVVELMTSLEFYESPVDMSEASTTFGVEPTSLEDFARAMTSVSAN